jgi:hypothetical protein
MSSSTEQYHQLDNHHQQENNINWETSSTGKHHQLGNNINWMTGGINIIHLVIWHHDH